MKHHKVASILLLVAMLSSFPLAMTQAADPTLVTGTIEGILLETDPLTEITTVVVYFTDGAGVLQKARIDLETAITLQLIIPDSDMIGQDLVIPDPSDPALELGSGIVVSLALVTDPITLKTTLDVVLTDLTNPPFSLDLETAIGLALIIPNPAMIDTPIELDPVDILEIGEYSDKTTLLFNFFGAQLALTPDMLAAYEDGGIGFGVLAEALWITARLGGDAALLDQILVAKKSSDFSTIVLPDGSTPTNWGQLRKSAILDPHDNPGQIVSGKAEPLTEPALLSPDSSVTNAVKVRGKSAEEHGKSLGKDKKK